MEKPKGEKIDSPSPQWVRTTLCEDLAIQERNQGRIPDGRAIEQHVDAEIEIFQKAERKKEESHTHHYPAKKQPKLNKDDPAADLAKQLGYKLIRQPASKPKQSLACTCGVCKVCAMMVRVRTLVATKPGTKGRAFDFIFPRFGTAIMNEFSDMPRGRGRYKGLSVANTHKAYFRALEDICDRSNSAIGLGGWWVPK